MITVTAFGGGQSVAVTPITSMSALLSCTVRLIDRRTGLTHRVNGAPVVIRTQEPHRTASDLLRGRNPDIWEARIEVLRPGGH